MSNLVATTPSSTLQRYLTEEISSFKKSDWIGTLFVPNITLITKDKDGNDVSTTGTIDICQYLPGGSCHTDVYAKITKLRFDSSIFPPPKTGKLPFETSNPTYVKLRQTLQCAAIECGYSLVPKANARFTCKCGRTYKNGTNIGSQRVIKNIVTFGVHDKENDVPQSVDEGIATLCDDNKENDVPVSAGEGKETTGSELQRSLRERSWKFDSKNSRKKGSEPLPRNTSTSLPIYL